MENEDDEDRIGDKIIDIEKYLEELATMIPAELEEYEDSISSKAACERYIEKIVGAVVDLGFLTIKEKDLDSPETEPQIFEILCKNNIIKLELSKRLKDAKKMRNVIVHQYREVNDETVFHALNEELFPDVEEFIKAICDYLRR